MVFDIVINTPEGTLFCAYLNRNIDKVAEDMDSTKTKIPIQPAQIFLGNVDEECTRLSEIGLG